MEYRRVLESIRNVQPGQHVLVAADPHLWYSPMYKEYEQFAALLRAAREMVKDNKAMLFVKRQGKGVAESYISYVLVGVKADTPKRLDELLQRHWIGHQKVPTKKAG